MTEEECLELLAHLRGRVRDAGLTAFDDSVSETLRDVEGRPGRLLLTYVEELDTALAARSGATAAVVLERLGRYGAEGLRVRFTDADAALAGTEELDLVGDRPDLGRERALLRELTGFLREQLGDTA